MDTKKNNVRHSRGGGNLTPNFPRKPLCPSDISPCQGGKTNLLIEGSSSNPHHSCGQGELQSKRGSHGGGGNLCQTPTRSPHSRGWRSSYFGFTLVEIIASITILATISIIAYVSTQWYVKKSYNSRRIASIDSLKTSLDEYTQLKKSLPDPTSNEIYYDTHGSYMHAASGSYGVSGYASKEFLSATYNLDATDPETRQFYGYGKRSDDSAFDVAASVYDDVSGWYKSYLRGSYDGKRLVSLVRSYSSSDFVVDGSSDALPYNPYERKITGKLETWSGTVTAQTSAGTSLALTGELNQGDKITVNTGSTAVLHLSDGSEFSLGSASGSTILELSSLTYSDDNNLASKVALFLQSGEAWVKAPHLRTETGTTSDFSVQTDTAVAAVRGTIFGMNRYPNGSYSHTDVMVLAGKVEIMQKSSTGFIPPTSTQNGLPSFSNELNMPGSSLKTFSGTLIFPTATAVGSTGSYINESGHTSIQTVEGATPARFGIDGYIYPSSATINYNPSTAFTGTAVEQIKIDTLKQEAPFSTALTPTALSITGSTIPATGTTPTQQNISLAIENPGADWYEMTFDTGASNTIPVIQSGSLDATYTGATLTGSIVNESGTITFRLCKRGSHAANMRCSRKRTIVIPKNLSEMKKLASVEDKLTLGKKKDIVTAIQAANVQAQNGCVSTGSLSFWPMVDTFSYGNPTSPWQTWSYSTTPGDCTYTCKGGYREFCDEYGSWLVAYAPYDKVGDLNMYDRNGSTLSIRSDNIAYGYQKLDWSSCDNNDTDLPASITPSYYNKSSSFVRMSSTLSGIYINQGTNNYIRHDIDTLGLGNNFSIEMSVRGEALTRGSANNLLNFSGGTTNLFLRFQNSWKYLVSTSSSYSGSFSTWGISPNQFYKVAFSYSYTSGVNATCSVSIPGILNPTPWSCPQRQPTSSFLFIGSNASLSLQWDDIIDYVKIYNNP